MRLSVIIPNFNHASEFPRAVEAAASQAPYVDEIIIIDDGSTDNSLEVIDELKARHPVLRCVRLPKNQGAIAALNRGIKEARGTYVNFAAADDIVLPGLFRSMLELIERHPQAAFASCEAVLLDLATGRSAVRPPVRPSYKEAYFDPTEVRALLRHIDNWILIGTAVVRRDHILRAGGFDGSLGAVADGFLLRKLALTHGFCFAPREGLIWRVRSSGLSRSLATNLEAGKEVLARAIAKMAKDDAFPSWYPETFTHRWRFAVGRIATTGEPMNRDILCDGCGPLGRAIMGSACAVGGPLGRMAALGWLTLRDRPTSVVGVVRTALARRLEQRRKSLRARQAA